jgi:iron complex transport system permease protein
LIRPVVAVACAALCATWAMLTALEVWLPQTPPFALAPGDVGRGVLAALDLGEPIAGPSQVVVELRLWRALTAGGVGACLALAGGMLQGLFRNGLAEPSLLGVSSGANLGATLAILLLGGYSQALFAPGAFLPPIVITAAAFAGALAVALFVMVLAARSGTIAVTDLLLLGVAVNTCILGGLAAVQSFVLEDHEVTKAIRSWTFGNLDDRAAYHAVMVAAGALGALAAVPFVATELDLFAAGEDDARALGVATGRTKLAVLAAAAFATACAFAAAGQIAFVGLLVPHGVRALFGPAHRGLLLLAAPAGAVFLLACDLLQLVALGERRLQTGVLMAVLGGPMFLVLLLREAKRRVGW